MKPEVETGANGGHNIRYMMTPVEVELRYIVALEETVLAAWWQLSGST